eukprot:2520064-Rhodomonas_salina.4
MGVAVAAARPRIAISEATLQQVRKRHVARFTADLDAFSPAFYLHTALDGDRPSAGCLGDAALSFSGMQMVASQMAAGQQAGITVQELMLNMAQVSSLHSSTPTTQRSNLRTTLQFGAMEADGAGRITSCLSHLLRGRSMAEENDPELREALERSIRSVCDIPKESPSCHIPGTHNVRRKQPRAAQILVLTWGLCSDQRVSG